MKNQKILRSHFLMTFRDDFSLSLKKNFNNHSLFAFFASFSAYIIVIVLILRYRKLGSPAGLRKPDRLRQAGSMKGFFVCTGSGRFFLLYCIFVSFGASCLHVYLSFTV